MVRCGCSDACSCLIVAGTGVFVDGIGTVERPYEISSESAELNTRLEFDDDGNVDFDTSGDGTPESPLHVSGNVDIKLTELADVNDPSGMPIDGEVPTWVGSHWEFRTPAGGGGGGGSLPVGGLPDQVLTKLTSADGDAAWRPGLPAGGTTGQVLAKASSTDKDTAWVNAATGGGSSSSPSAWGSWYLAANQTIPNAVVTIVTATTALGTPVGLTMSAGGQVTIESPGLYVLSVRAAFVGNATGNRYIYLYVNGAYLQRIENAGYAAGNQTLGGTMVTSLAAGDVVDMRVYQTSGASLDVVLGNKGTAFSLSKVDPLHKFGDPSVSAAYYRAAALTLPSGATTTVIWDTAENAADGISYASGTGIFTVTSPGWYHISSSVRITPNAVVANTNAQLRLAVNGNLWDYTQIPIDTFTTSASIWLDRQIKLAAGDTLSFSIIPNAACTLAVSTYHHNSVQITRIDGGPALASSGGLTGIGSVADPLKLYDSGWVVGGSGTSVVVADPTNFTLTTSWARRVGSTVYLYFYGALKVASSSPGTTGDISNLRIATAAAQFAPSGVILAQVLSSGNVGRVANGYIASSDGGISIGSVSGSAALPIGDTISLGGSYLID
jgi:hypothetical protein